VILSIETLAAFAVAHLLAAASPGPNFFLVTGFAMSSSRRHALLSAIGILASVAVWSSAAAAGLGLVLDRFPLVYEALRLLGAGYLIWLGVRMLRGALRTAADRTASPPVPQASYRGAILRGFFVNITNPKTVAYYTSLFAVLIPPEASSAALVEIVAVALAVSGAWWVSVALAFSTDRAKRLFDVLRRPIELIAGGAFVLFGLRIATRGTS